MPFLSGPNKGGLDGFQGACLFPPSERPRDLWAQAAEERGSRVQRAGGGAGLLLKALLELAGADTCDYPCLSQVQLELQQTDHCGPSVLGSLATSLGK